MLKKWFRFFRIVNLPTVPGDALVGMSAVAAASLGAGSGAVRVEPAAAVAAAAALSALYLFGLADNDIVGAATDGVERPIPAGELSLGAARLARGACLFAALAVGAAANLPPAWWIVGFALAVAIVAYNRMKCPFVMGLCRALGVCTGAAAVSCRGPLPSAALLSAVAVAALWCAYVTAVTFYAKGEDAFPGRRPVVGALLGAIVYLQLAALLLAYETAPCEATRWSLVAGAVMLLVLRVVKKTLPEVSAS